MAIQPDISLAVKPPQFNDPLETAGKVLAIRGAQQQAALTSQHLAAGELSMQQARQGIADDQAARQFFSQNPNASDEDMISKLGPKVAHPIIQERYKSQEAQLKMAGEKTDLFGRIAELIKDESTFHAGVQSALHLGLMKPEEASQLHQQGWTPETQALIQQHAQQGMKAKEQIDAALAKVKEQREASESDAKMPGLVAESTVRQQEATGTKPIQPEQQARLDLQKLSQDQVAVHNAATEKNATALLKVAQGRLGIEQQHAQIAQKIYDQTYGDGANPALVGVEPKLRAAAAAEAQKAADEYTKAAESTGNMQSIIDLARKGNRVAYAYAPTTGVLTINSANGVKRVNMAEIKAYSGAGSAVDKVEGWLGKQVSGASIPDDILKAMEQVNKSTSDNLANSYEKRRQSLNTNYHAAFPSVIGKSAGATLRARDPQGVLHEAPAGTALPAGWKMEQ